MSSAGQKKQEVLEVLEFKVAANAKANAARLV